MRGHEAEAMRWFLQAVDDRKFAEWVFREGQFFDKGCFICQQAGEKALKACLHASGKRHVLGHSFSRNGLPGGIPCQAYSAKDLESAIEDLGRIFEFARLFLSAKKIPQN